MFASNDTINFEVTPRNLINFLIVIFYIRFSTDKYGVYDLITKLVSWTRNKKRFYVLYNTSLPQYTLLN